MANRTGPSAGSAFNDIRPILVPLHSKRQSSVTSY